MPRPSDHLRARTKTWLVDHADLLGVGLVGIVFAALRLRHV